MTAEDQEFRKRVYAQFRKIETDRYFEGIKRKHDPRDDENYDLEWVKKNAEEFDKLWKESACKTCQNFKECGFKLVKSCERFDEGKKQN